MSETVLVFIYIGLGLLGAYFHWLKKRYKDKETNAALGDYIFTNFYETLYSVGSMMFVEITLAAGQVGDFTLTSFVAAVSAGYSLDSALNKLPPNIHEEPKT